VEINNGEEKINRASLPMLSLTIPLLFENGFRILLSSVDTFMLSSWSQKAVAAAGMIGQYIFFIQILFNVICIGTSIVLSQYLGAKRNKEAEQVTQGSVLMISLVALFIMLLIFFGAAPLLSLYSIEDDVRHMAWQYLVIFGGFGAFFMALNMLQGTVLRAYGYTKDAMYIAIVANILNILGNAISLYGFFGLPVLGIAGVAASSAFSQLAASIILAIRIRQKKDVRFPLKRWRDVSPSMYRVVLSVGVPTAGENLSYNVAQIVIMVMVSTFGTWAMSAMVYTQTIARFVGIFGLSIGTATQIKVGYWVGAKKPEDAYRRVYLYQIIATTCTVFFLILINIFKVPIIALFTDEKEIVSMVYRLLLFSIYLEFGRSINLVTISALKGAGDFRFPVLYGLFSMWGIMVLGSYLLGVKAAWGLVGIWLSIGSDETIRGFVMLFRWRSKKWITKRLK
jgi:putative MATE family efflux protein